MRNLFSSAVCALLLGANAAAQETTEQAPAQPEVFASENAILDTSIPFAIGAQEIRQSLRGAFGWPTFQEGLVEGVYYRFDPDGYARFSPSPRLDTDVFEVICRPRTITCQGRKQEMIIELSPAGLPQLKLENVVEGDQFFILEGVSEIQVPDRILLPLQPQLETLISAGGELIIRRGSEEAGRVSLTGVPAVLAYMRWIAARQDYNVLPRNWPIPNAGGDDSQSITQISNWPSPMPQPQALAVTGGQQVQIAAAAQTTTLPQPQITPQDQTIAALEAQLAELRGLIGTQGGNTQTSVAEPMPKTPALSNTGTVRDVQPIGKSAQATQHMAIGLPKPMENDLAMAGRKQMSQGSEVATRLQVLMDQVGLDFETAIAVLELSDQSDETIMGITTQNMPKQQIPTPSTSNDVVAEILRELELDMTSTKPDTDQNKTGSGLASVSAQEYQLLSAYFKSVALGEN